MDALCSKILTYSDWSEEEQGRAVAGVLGLTDEKVSVLTRLPEAVLKTSLQNLRAQRKFQKCHSCREHCWYLHGCHPVLRALAAAVSWA